MAEKKRKLAGTEHPTIAAICDGMFRFREQEEAVKKLQALPKHFIVSQRRSKPKQNRVVLWVKGYKVTKAEAKEGYLGHYATVDLAETEDGKWTLNAEKIDVDLKSHPQRKYVPTGNHPNWGHPILRGIKRGKVYETAEDAAADMQTLHEQYPGASIPGKSKLYLIIYGKPPRKEDADIAGNALFRNMCFL